ncbi:general transcription factor IIH subunit 4 isoform X2 [Hippoglossus stenolepis]|uniref:general transcription factor IIH subunit 4 isoform X2 n=1 Tax=Hippoglossus stenolepis TaxID=195615 RepID=UPI00159CA5EE|nr:general transcription factor IIH subunit 4 isoform X2 [Hippoglossus stenolepis]
MNLRVQLKCKNLHEYLRELSPDILDRLYNHPSTCLAVYRELPSMAKNYVIRMLFLDQPLPQAAVALWVNKDNQKDHDECVSVLVGLCLWHSQQLQGGLQGYILNPVFKDNLTIALLGGGRAWADEGSTLGPDRHARDIESLDRYAMERWEVILHFMVGSPSAAVSQDLAQLLVQAGLMKSESGEAPYITSAGFQFLLLDTASQLWYFTLQYLKTAQSRGMVLVEILSFLFQLSFSTLGRDYSVEGMSESLLTFLQHLREFGLVFQRKRKSRRYYPTRLAITLAAGVTTSASSCSNFTSTPGTGDEGFIVVETNYRIYAYTNSELQIALVALFSEMLYHFPNVVVAQVTRESVQQAIANGITAQQTPVLPPTITDQIRLWELERDRLQFTEGVLYNQFLSQADFEVLRDRAQGLGCLVWQDVAHRVMVVTPQGHSEVKRFWKRQKSHS